MEIIGHFSFNPSTKQIVDYNDVDSLELVSSKGGIAIQRRRSSKSKNV